MNEKQEKANINLNIDPNKTPVLMVDTYVIGSNEHIVTLNFAQAFLASPQQNIVARVAMTRA